MAINIKMKMWELLLSIVVLIVIPVVLITMFLNKENKEKHKEAISVNEFIGKTAEKKVVKLVDSDGAIFYLPKGFKISEEILEPKVANGIVIIDNTGDDQTNGSEFVWIPVENETHELFKSKFVSKNGYINGELDSNFDKYKTGSKDADEYKLIEESVFKYGGFYIARYEAGVSEKMMEKLSKSDCLEEGKISKDTTKEFASGKFKPVSKNETMVWNYIKWGGTFDEKSLDGLAGNEKENGAVKVARSMYNKNSKTTVKSNLCYGMQWDAVMNFIDSNYFDEMCTPDSVIVNSQDAGNYSGELYLSGYYNENNNTKNIFDLAGNVFEWTMEGYEEKQRAIRGGGYSNTGIEYSMSSRKAFYPSDYYKDLGFRVALYIGK